MANAPRKAAATRAPGAPSAAPSFAEKMKAAKAAKAAAAVTASAPAVTAPATAPAPVQEALPVETPQTELPDYGMTDYDHFLDTCRAIDGKFADPAPKESEQAFYKRVLATIAAEQDTGNDDKGEPILLLWDALGDARQAWYNAGADAMAAGLPIPVMAGYASRPPVAAPAPAPGKQAPGAGLARYREEQAKLKAEGKQPAKAAKEPKVLKQPKAPGEQRMGPVRITRMMIVENLTSDVAGIEAMLKAAGHSIKHATVATLYNDTRATLRIALDNGLMKPGFTLG